MFLTYLKIAWRNVMRHKIHSLQNILGLSLALAVALAGFVYIYHETSYDSAYKNADRIFRINTDMLIGEQDRQTAQCSDVIGPLWKNHFAEVESFVRLYPISSVKIKKENNYILEGRAAYAPGKNSCYKCWQKL